MVALGDSGELGTHALRMRAAFQQRTGAFSAEDAWFEARARAFWDDALTTQGFAALAAGVLGSDDRRAFASCLARAHRGFFTVEDADERGACLVDLWSGAELLVRYVDPTQALSFDHAEGAIDARVTATPSGSTLYVLPGAYHHAADALDPAASVLEAAKKRGLSTRETLDALLRMDLVLRASSRVKAAFAYRVESLAPRG